ncbi:hypothetical protein BDP27DRAFT_1385895 [Rhodocollybia butyracea]|uniref:DNA 3'-5' helicase n=1 Tax=Rhodocollybia butyracea TaxID=206335 RepID=A0A9P5P891_9AGAR|nr:hypothetical protein BDP27DRAFT_1385895 [Rhodocollybia butyracea]
MPPKYPQALDEGRLEKAERVLCEIFEVSELREHQKLAGRNILQGKSTVYDVPTGGGKILAFCISVSQKVALVVSPLNALMNSQVEALQKRGIPALAVNNEKGTGSIDDIFEIDEGGQIRVKHRVIFISPETAVSTPFHEKVLKIRTFREHCIEVDVIHDVLFKVGLPQDSARIAVSNAKYNIALSVRILQHPGSTYADLFTLFPVEPDAEFPQTLIYVNNRKEAEEIQDFLRRHCPSHLPTSSVETRLPLMSRI